MGKMLIYELIPILCAYWVCAFILNVHTKKESMLNCVTCLFNTKYVLDTLADTISSVAMLTRDVLRQIGKP